MIKYMMSPLTVLNIKQGDLNKLERKYISEAKKEAIKKTPVKKKST